MSKHLLIRAATLGCAAVVWLGAAPVSAAYIPPLDLGPGQPYQLIFFTSGERNALSHYIADYNNFVTADAALHPELPAATWRAIVSTATVVEEGMTIPGVSARNNAINYEGIPVYNTRGERVCDGEWGTWGYGERSDLYNAGLDNHHAAIYDPDGNPLGVQYVATGSWFTGSDKYAAGRPPWSEGWPMIDCYITVGLPDQLNNYWIDREMDFGNFSLWNYRFYGLSSILTVPVPEPSTFLLVGMGAFGLFAFAWLKRKA